MTAATPALDQVALAPVLARGLAALNLDLPADAQQRLLAYLALMQRWNRTYNLTAIRDADQMLVHHLLDSLAPLPNLTKSALAGRRLRVADVGSGAGLPGIPWAIAMPDWRITLIEAVAKKSAFQRQAKIELCLDNLAVIGERVERLPPGGYDLVTARAFASLSDQIALAGHLLDPDGRLCALKGLYPEDELQALPEGWCLESAVPLAVPGLDAQRHLLMLRKC